MNIAENVKLRLVKAASESATGDVNSDVVDMAGFDGVMFFTVIGTANAGNYIKAQQDAAATFDDDPQDLEGTKVVAGADGEVVGVDIYKPLERYVRLAVTRTAATKVGEIYALQYQGRVKPTVNVVADTINIETHVSPDEGTA